MNYDRFEHVCKRIINSGLSRGRPRVTISIQNPWASTANIVDLKTSATESLLLAVLPGSRAPGRAPQRDSLPRSGTAQDARARLGQRKSSNYAPGTLENIVDLKTSATESLPLAVLLGSQVLGRAPWRYGLPCPGATQDTRARLGQSKSSNHVPATSENIADLKASTTESLPLAVLPGSWALGQVPLARWFALPRSYARHPRPYWTEKVLKPCPCDPGKHCRFEDVRNRIITSGSIARILGLGRAPWRDGLPCPGGPQDTRARIGQRKSSNHVPATPENIVEDVRNRIITSGSIARVLGPWLVAGDAAADATS